MRVPACRPMGTKGSASAIARAIIRVTIVDARTPAPQAATPAPSPAAQLSLTASSPRSSIQAAVSQGLAITFESCGSCGYQWVQLTSTLGFLVPVLHPAMIPAPMLTHALFPFSYLLLPAPPPRQPPGSPTLL